MKHDAPLPQRDAALLDACRRGDTERALQLIAEGADIRATDEEEWTPMGYACLAGNEPIVEELLRRGVHPMEESGRWGRPALYRAAESGNVALMHKLVLAGAVVLYSDCEGDTCFSAAIHGNSTAAFDYLLDMGLYIEDESPHGSNLMYLALQSSDDTFFHYLRRQGRSVHYYSFHTVLQEAYELKNKGIIRRLLQEGGLLTTLDCRTGSNLYDTTMAAAPFDEELADMLYKAGLSVHEALWDLDSPEDNCILDNCKTPEARAWAIAHGADKSKVILAYPEPKELYKAACVCEEKLKQCLAEGRNINAADRDGNTALFFACANGNSLAIRRLLAEGADAGRLNRLGYSVLTLERWQKSGTPPPCVEELFRHGLAPESIGEEGHTMLTGLLSQGRYALAMALLRCGVDVNHRDDAAYTPFLAAARYGNAAVMQRLEELGADPHAILPDGRTALHLAAQYQQEGIVRYLLARGHEVDALDRRNATPLLSGSSPVIAHLLLDAGANPLLRAKNGMTALMAVKHSKEAGISERLIRAGVNPKATTLWGSRNPLCFPECESYICR